MDIRYEIFAGLPSGPLLDGLLSLHLQIFQGPARDHLLEEYQSNLSRNLLTILALSGDTVAGYKMGYQRKKGHFYSWLGCVSPDFRRLGIGGRLMQLQHDYCRENGFHTIRTHTRNQWRDMLVLNIRHGFDVVGTITTSGAHTTIVLEKRL
ncbi:GNAT family N-acetyltransferase [Larkinella soli]|uniref:GNAT family N-acetyltransferase n=1 Tax=Larkinella soli TaxID=1770527 RepID=UPI000FFB38C1|nr:GNAT family N-acetyltransferase [Larkinella soli]